MGLRVYGFIDGSALVGLQGFMQGTGVEGEGVRALKVLELWGCCGL